MMPTSFSEVWHSLMCDSRNEKSQCWALFALFLYFEAHNMPLSLNVSVNDSCDVESTEQAAAVACETSCCRWTIEIESSSTLVFHLLFIQFVRSLYVPLKCVDESATRDIQHPKAKFEKPEFSIFFHLIFCICALRHRFEKKQVFKL